MAEFDLGKRIIVLPDSNDLDDELKTAKVLLIKDIREFIKRLNNFSRKIKGADGDWININIINELAGKNLTREVQI